MNYDIEGFKKAKGSDPVDCWCDTCNAKEQRKKVNIKTALKRGATTFTCNECKSKANKTGYTVNCLQCNNAFYSKKSENRKFCSQSCATGYNNHKRTRKPVKTIKRKRKKQTKIENQCNYCQSTYIVDACRASTRKYCSPECSQADRSKQSLDALIEKIESGQTQLSDNIETTNSLFKKYLIHKHGANCMKCGWGEVNTYTGRVPIELEHKDGNCTNNQLDNLELLCPNCHSLTSTYKGANKIEGGSPRYQLWKKYFKTP